MGSRWPIRAGTEHPLFSPNEARRGAELVEGVGGSGLVGEESQAHVPGERGRGDAVDPPRVPHHGVQVPDGVRPPIYGSVPS